MQCLIITRPTFVPNEAQRIVDYLKSGKAQLVHIRKPQASKEEVEGLILQIPAEWHKWLVLHDHFDLAVRYGLYGVHLNSRNPLPPEGWSGSVSRSCHQPEELEKWKQRCNYVSLSPIFDSISKQGYQAAFSLEVIAEARRCGLIDKKVYALGGVTFARLTEVENMGFGGAMILGDAWK